LLQKKIPPEFFKSTFIEFETFGKLKKSDYWIKKLLDKKLFVKHLGQLGELSIRF
jgi:hypothetical protein